MLYEFWDSLSLLKRLYDQTVEPVARSHDITRMELDILLFLANNPSFDTAADMVERRQLTKSHVSTSIADLVAREFLERFFRDGNKKLVHLRLLDAASPIITEGRQAQQRFFAAILAGFTPEQSKLMADHLQKIAANARAAQGGNLHV